MNTNSQLEIVMRITTEGLQPPEIHADSESEEKAAEEMLERIQPCLDVINAILKKSSAGPGG